MRIGLDRTGTAEGFRRLMAELSADPGVRSILMLACADNPCQAGDYADALRDVAAPVAGGLFPAVLHGREVLDRGCVAVGFPVPARVHLVQGLDDPDRDFEAELDRIVEPDTGLRTVLVLADALSSGVSAFVAALYSMYGLEVNYVGGGVGRLSGERAPALLAGARPVSGGAVVMELDLASRVGVRHGFTPVAGPFRVTESEGPVIRSLDWEPAEQAYRRAVAAQGGPEPEPGAFFERAQAHPLGLLRLDGECVVRDPYRPDGRGGIVCVGDLPAGSAVNLLHGSREGLLAAAVAARDEAALPPVPDGICLVMDCVSRRIFLGPDFGRELDLLNEPGLPLAGACSMGEIANSRKSFLELFNKTLVCSVLWRP